MSAYMTVPEFDRWIEAFKVFPAKLWLGTRAHIAKYIREGHMKRLTAHQTPEGQPWKETWFAPAPKIGDRAPMIVSRGPLPGIGQKQRFQSARTGQYPAVVVETIRTASGVRRALAFRKRYGPPLKAEPALIRKTGSHKVKRIWEFLSRAGRSVRYVKRAEGYGLEYGYTRGTRWIEDLQNGGQYRRRSGDSPFRSLVANYNPTIPPREMVGLTAGNVAEITGYLADQYERFVREGRAG